jgi:DNA polymerase I-like protein with 3'-5' exonuclease and polymerase domains
MGAASLAMQIGCSEIEARELLARHRRTYPKFWAWTGGVVDYAAVHGRLWSVFGWRLHVAGRLNARSWQNFPMQANGAEILRLACCLVTEAGIEICAPVHDALLICAPLEDLDETVAETQRLMGLAASIVLGGFEIRTDAEVIRYPDRYRDPRGDRMWELVMGLL